MVTSNENILFSYKGDFKNDKKAGKGILLYKNEDW